MNAMTGFARRGPVRGMSQPSPRDDWWNTRAFVVVAMLASVIPLIAPRVPPLVDLPGHMGRFRVMLDTDPATLGRWYQFHWHLVGNLGVDLLVRLLGPLIGLEGATKAVVLTIPPLTVLGILWIAREVHGRVHPFALFSLPLAYGYPFQFGFVNYALAIALGLNAFAGWLALGRLGRRRLRAALFVPVSFLLWLTHLVGWGAFGVLVLSAEWIRARDQGAGWASASVRTVRACLPLAGPGLLLVLWRSSATGGMTSGWGRYDLKLSWLAMILRDRWMPFDVAATAVIYLILYKGARDPAIRYSRNLAVSALALLAVFAVLPMIIFGSAYADMRLAPLIVIIALLSLRPGAGTSERERHRLALGGLALFVVRTAGTTLSFLQAAHDMERQVAAADHLPRGSVVVTLIGSSCVEGWAIPRLSHLPSLALERRSVFANDQWLLDGAPLLSVDAPALVDFTNDPSQMVLDRPCKADPTRRPIADALGSLPRAAVTYLWLIDPPAYDPRAIGPAAPIWRSGTSVLFRLDHRADGKRL